MSRCEVLTHHGTFRFVCPTVQQGRLLLGSVLSQGLLALPLVVFLLHARSLALTNLKWKKLLFFGGWYLFHAILLLGLLGQQLADLWPLLTEAKWALLMLTWFLYLHTNRPTMLHRYIAYVMQLWEEIKK